ncbi:MAG: DegT/DnrJ/EryC1/StrS family aminotransferase [Thermoproteota archaeon]|nr:DegT/DnrJ/EryC1/StrS family aminotransferase [Thermoproteota archaeon]
MSTSNMAMIPINKPWLDEEERHEVMSVLDENTLTTAAHDGGKRVRDFESNLKEYLRAKHVIAVNSGTAALHAALLAAGVKQGDEVLLPSFTFVATANSVIAAGAKPIFVDINREDYTIDISDLRRKITKNSKAIIPVHLYGHVSDMDGIIELATKHSIEIIEDACQSLGSTYKKKQTGTFGLMGCFSMYASKVLTSGEGGAVTTNDDNLADKLKMIRNHGMVEGYDTRIFGLNLRLPELSAAIAKVQMKKLTKMLELRRRNAELLTKLLLPIADRIQLKLPQEYNEKKFNWYLYTIALKRNNIRDKIKDKMIIQDKIGATVYYNPPVHKTPYYEKIISEANRLTNTNWASEHVLSLPVHPLITEMDIGRIESSLKGIL